MLHEALHYLVSCCFYPAAVLSTPPGSGLPYSSTLTAQHCQENNRHFVEPFPNYWPPEWTSGLIFITKVFTQLQNRLVFLTATSKGVTHSAIKGCSPEKRARLPMSRAGPRLLLTTHLTEAAGTDTWRAFARIFSLWFLTWILSPDVCIMSFHKSDPGSTYTMKMPKL